MNIWSSKFVHTTEKFESGVMIGIDLGGHFKKPKCGNGKSQLKSHCVLKPFCHYKLVWKQRINQKSIIILSDVLLFLWWVLLQYHEIGILTRLGLGSLSKKMKVLDSVGINSVFVSVLIHNWFWKLESSILYGHHFIFRTWWWFEKKM